MPGRRDELRELLYMCEDATLQILRKVPGSLQSKKARERKFSEFNGGNARKSEARKLEQAFCEPRTAMAIN
jgi:hypothetical protein